MSVQRSFTIEALANQLAMHCYSFPVCIRDQ